MTVFLLNSTAQGGFMLCFLIPDFFFLLFLLLLLILLTRLILNIPVAVMPCFLLLLLFLCLFGGWRDDALNCKRSVESATSRVEPESGRKSSLGLAIVESRIFVRKEGAYSS
jgi:hypothetical protein